MGNENLLRGFRAAGLHAEVVKTSFVRGVNGSSIFQMDIRKLKDKPNQDSFRVFPSDADVHILGADNRLGQVVLFCKERARKFVQRERFYGKAAPVRPGDTYHGGKVTAVSDREVWIERVTPEEKRHFLMGHDERVTEYFIAQLPFGATSVRQAHDVLRPEEIRRKEVERQGEWFFVETSAKERVTIDSLGPLAVMDEKVNIAIPYHFGTMQRGGTMNNGNSHIVDEAVLLYKDGEDLTRKVVTPNVTHTLYVRGKVRHPEHDTKFFPNWMRVLRNTEKVDTSRGASAFMRGVSWVD